MNGITLRGNISILSGAQKMAISVRIFGAQLSLVLQGPQSFYPSTRESAICRDGDRSTGSDAS
jgi:hypothetical protein